MGIGHKSGRSFVTAFRPFVNLEFVAGGLHLINRGYTIVCAEAKSKGLAVFETWGFSYFPIWKYHQSVVTDTLVRGPAHDETPRRARGATGAQYSVQVADAGSNPAGSILPFVVEKFVWGENTEIISPSNLT